MRDTPNLRIPGPTPVPQDILEAVGRPMVDHRGRPFAALIQRVEERLKEFFQTKQDVLILSTSGTGSMEAAVVNTLSPDDKVLVVSIGAFGDRFAKIAETFGAQVTVISYEWGQAADPEDVRKALAADPEVRPFLQSGQNVVFEYQGKVISVQDPDYQAPEPVKQEIEAPVQVTAGQGPRSTGLALPTARGLLGVILPLAVIIGMTMVLGLMALVVVVRYAFRPR